MNGTQEAADALVRARNTFAALLTSTVSIGLVAALLAATFTPRSAHAQAAIKKGGTLVSAIPDNPPDLMNGVGTNILTGAIGGQIFDTLVRADRTMAIQPSLAKSWDISPDGLSVTFRLQAGVTWHDGRPFTSEDVRYSFLEINRKYNSIASGAFAAITRIDTPDPLTVVIHIGSPDPSFFPWSFAQPSGQVFPKHIYEGSDPRRNPMNFKPVGTGPFMFKEWARGSHLVLERNPNYFNADQVHLDRLIFQVIPDAGARQIAIERGDVDHLPYFSVTPSAVEPLSKHKAVQIIDTSRPALGEIIMFFNLRNAPLSSKDVRHAIAHAIDRELLVKLALNGRGKAATGPIRSDNPPFYTADVPKYPRDIARANALLDKAGFPRKAGGVRVALRLGYEATGEGGALQSAAEIMRQQLREIGIDLRLAPSDPASWQDASFIRWDFDMSMGSFLTGPDPRIGVSRLYFTKNIQRRNAGNLMGYSNPKVDELMLQADGEVDPTRRAELYHQVQKLMVEDLPALWLWEKSYPIAVRRGVVGLPSGAAHSEGYVGVGWAQ